MKRGTASQRYPRSSKYTKMEIVHDHYTTKPGEIGSVFCKLGIITSEDGGSQRLGQKFRGSHVDKGVVGSPNLLFFGEGRGSWAPKFDFFNECYVGGSPNPILIDDIFEVGSPNPIKFVTAFEVGSPYPI